MAIDRNFIQELTEKADIESVISPYITLKRSGRNLKGLCPFHNEKTPSFMVYPESNSFYCFGCGVGGSAITFVEKMENLDYVEAVKSLAEKFNMTIPENGYDDFLAKQRLRLYSANREAAKFFNSQLMLPENKHALDYYIKKRGLSPATITHFGLGYAPDSWSALTDHLKNMGYTEQELILANLSRRSQKSNRLYDNFRNRMMFPIIDLRGNVVAFSGRRYNEEEERKYVNTSDTPIYKKGGTIFALNFAKNSSDKTLLLMEGQIDVITCHQAGFTNAIACLGTALTSEQANIMSRYANEVLICYDSDEAGQKATRRALEILGKTDLKIKVIPMAGGKDADEIIRTYGPDKFREILSGQMNSVEYAIGNAMAKNPPVNDAGKLAFLNEAAEILAGCTPMEREIYVNRLSGEFNIVKDALMGQIKMAERKIQRQKEQKKSGEERRELLDSFQDKNNPQRASNLKVARAEEVIIASLARNPDFYRKLKDKFTPDDFITEFNKRIITRLVSLIGENLSTDVSMFSEDFSPDEMGSVTKIILQNEKLANTVKECEDCIQILKDAAKNGKIDIKNASDDEFIKFFADMKDKK